MARFQLAISVVLAASALFSALLFFWLSSPSGRLAKIQLPISSIESDDEFEPELAGEDDPFIAVTEPEDFVDGIPIEDTRFWATVSDKCQTSGTTVDAAVVLRTCYFQIEKY